MTTTLQNLIMPGLVFDAPEDMYVRAGTGVRVGLRDRMLTFEHAGRASFDTFFNALTVNAWRGVCGITDLALTLRGSGKFILRFGLHRYGYAHRWLEELTVELGEDDPITVPLPFWPGLESGLLYLTLEALGPAVLRGGRFTTAAAPARHVKLGIVITHFNRKDYVLPALQRIQDGLLEYETAAGMIELVVVDNSRNILPRDAAGATIIPNRNLGGSGGFMRGLLHLTDHGFSHCLFMDDDASCEVESILRCYAVMQFAAAEHLAVAGSLLREAEPYRLFEKGARFDGMCRPLKSGLDMRMQGDLLIAERAEVLPDYGGWWFFGFAIASVKHYAFPFFVRGDDIQFSAVNRFQIFTMNGLACWGEDFALKSGALPIYLDVRSHMLQSLCILGASRAAMARVLARFFLFTALSYNYATARAVTLALADVMKGPGFWIQDMEMNHKRAQIKEFSKAEQMLPIDRTMLHDLRHLPDHEPAWRRLSRIITLNGFLLPGVLLRDAVAFQHKGFSGALRKVFRFKRVLYEHEASQSGFVARHDKRAFFSALADFMVKLLSFIRRCERLRLQYRAALPDMTSEAFWRGIYTNELAVPAPPQNVSVAARQLEAPIT